MHTPIPTHFAKSTHTGTQAALSINKIVVVGHLLSGYEGVENLLNTCGMRPAAASQRDGLSAAQVGATLLKAHRVIPLDALQAHGSIEPLQPGPIWQSLALDLLLGNINHDLWGWSDPQAIYLLDYWKNLDPQLAFMLVYDTPQDLIARAFDNPAVACTPETLQTALGNWEAYNETLLQFYHRNPQRCLLVHAAQVRARAADCLHQVQTRIGAPLTSACDQDTVDSTQPPAALATVTNEACDALADLHQALRVYAAQALLTQQPLAMQRYEELQASASLPLAEQNQDPSSDPALRALQAVVALQKQHTQQQALQHQKLDSLIHEKTQAERLAAERQQQIDQLKQAAEQAPASAELQQENDLLLVQLHQVQEELERYYLENKRLKAKPSVPARPAQPPAPYGAAERVKQQLGYQLGSKMIERSRSLGGWLGMPFALIGVARQHQRELPKRKAAKQVPIEKYRDAYEAERVKQHLSYRLGSALIKHGKNPLYWPALPFYLQKARKAWLSEQSK